MAKAIHPIANFVEDRFQYGKASGGDAEKEFKTHQELDDFGSRLSVYFFCWLVERG